MFLLLHEKMRSQGMLVQGEGTSFSVGFNHGNRILAQGLMLPLRSSMFVPPRLRGCQAVSLITGGRASIPKKRTLDTQFLRGFGEYCQ